jgi:hypothetical protein
MMFGIRYHDTAAVGTEAKRVPAGRQQHMRELNGSAEIGSTTGLRASRSGA